MLPHGKEEGPKTREVDLPAFFGESPQGPFRVNGEKRERRGKLPFFNEFVQKGGEIL